MNKEKILGKTTVDETRIGFGKEVLKRRIANKLARKMRKENKRK